MAFLMFQKDGLYEDALRRAGHRSATRRERAVEPGTLDENELVRRCNKCTLVGHLDHDLRAGAPARIPVNDAFATPTSRSKSSACSALRRGKRCIVGRPDEALDLRGRTSPVDPSAVREGPRRSSSAVRNSRWTLGMWPGRSLPARPAA